MQCSVNGEMLSAFADGELTPSQAAAIRQHLAGCAGCRAQLAALRQVTGLVRSLEEVAPPSDLRARMAARVLTPAPVTCAQVGAQIDALVDGSLAAEQMEIVQAHLAECAGCRERYRLHEEMVSALRSMPLVDPPARLRERVYARQQPKPVWRLQPVWKAVTGAAGLAAAAAGLMLALRSPQLPPVPVAATPGPSDQVIAAQAPTPAATPAPALEASAAPGQAPVNAMRQGARRVMRFLASRPQRARPAPRADHPAARQQTTTDIAAASPAPEVPSEPEAVSTPISPAPAAEAPRAVPVAEPAPAPVIASDQPVTYIVQADHEVTTPDYAKAMIRVTPNERRPVEVKAFKLEF